MSFIVLFHLGIFCCLKINNCHCLIEASTVNMSKRLERNLASLQALAKANRIIQKSMISHGSKDFILALVECVSNIIRGNVKLTAAQLRELQPFEHQLRKFIRKKTSQKDRKVILQKGGFLGALVKPLLSLLGLS